MSRTRKHPKRRKPFNPVKTFFKVMLSIVMAFVVLAGGACFAYHKVTGEYFGGDTIAKMQMKPVCWMPFWAEI